MVPQGIADLPPLAEEGSVKLRAGHPPAKAVGLIGCRRQGGDLITKQAPFFYLLGKKKGAILRFFISVRPPDDAVRPRRRPPPAAAGGPAHGTLCGGEAGQGR